MNGFIALAVTALDCPHFVSAVLRRAELFLRDYDAIAPHMGLLREEAKQHAFYTKPRKQIPEMDYVLATIWRLHHTKRRNRPAVRGTGAQGCTCIATKRV